MSPARLMAAFVLAPLGSSFSASSGRQERADAVREIPRETARLCRDYDSRSNVDGRWPPGRKKKKELGMKFPRAISTKVDELLRYSPAKQTLRKKTL